MFKKARTQYNVIILFNNRFDGTVLNIIVKSI